MEYTTIGESCSVVSGGTPSRSKNEYWRNGTIPWMKIGNIKSKYVNEYDELITEQGLNNSSAKLLKKGTILYTIFATLGEVGILDIEACTNQAIAGININDPRITTDYLYYYLKSKKDYVNNIGRGVAQNNINLTTLKKFEIPLINVDKQLNIVEILEKVERMIDLKKKEIDDLDLLIKARFVEMFGDPANNPKKFEEQSLKDTCKIITGNTPSRAVEEYYGDFVEWIKTDNIVSGAINPTRAVEYLSEEGMKAGRVVKEDTILMACIAGSIASIGRVCVTDRTVAFNQQINAIVPKDYNPLFLYVLLQISKDYLIEDVSMALKGILSKSKLEEKEFIVPPLELQQQFADFVQQVDKSKLAVQKSLEKTQQLFDSLMQEYFG